MKKITNLHSLHLAYFLFAQVPNGGFESWTSGSPEDSFNTNIPYLINNS